MREALEVEVDKVLTMWTALRPSVLRKDSLMLNVGEFEWMSQLLNGGDRGGEGLEVGVEVEVEAEGQRQRNWTWNSDSELGLSGHKLATSVYYLLLLSITTI